MTTAREDWREHFVVRLVCLGWHPVRDRYGCDQNRDEAWIALPAKPRQEGDKTVFQPTVAFDDAATAAAFSRAAIVALDNYSGGWRL